MIKIAVKGDIVANGDKWIYDWLGIESVSPSEVLKALADAKEGDVEIEINSGGGDVFAGSEIYTALRSYTGNLTISIVGIAASAAGVVAQAGKSRITPTGMFMLHNVSGGARGDYHALEHSAGILRTANLAVANAYKSKTGMTDEQLLALMDKETWLSAEQAVELGFVDGVMFESRAPALYNSAQSLNRGTLEKLRAIIKNPGEDASDIFTLKNAQAKLNLLKLRRNT